MSSRSFIKFVGTGSGKTSLKRFHSSIFFSTPDYNLLVDAGEGISKALLSQKISFDSIDGILFTHLHPDHFLGFPSLIVQMKLASRRKRKLDVFIEKSLRQRAEELLYRSYIFNENLGFKIDYKEFSFDKEIIITKDFSFSAKQNSHLDKYVKYANNEKLSFSCSSFLFKIGAANVFYSGDIGSKKDLMLFDKEKIDIMISEISHVGIEEIMSVNNKIKPHKFFLTHISGEDDISPKTVKGLIPAKDGMKFYI